MIEEEARIIMEIRTELQNKISVRLSNELSRGKITIPQYNILLSLKEAGSVTMSNLANKLGVTMAAITPLVDKLIKRDLARRERSRTDRRVVRATLTRKGNSIVSEIQKEVYDVIICLLKKLDPKERKKLIEIYQKIHKILKTKEI